MAARKDPCPAIVRVTWFDVKGSDAKWVDRADLEAETECPLIDTVGFLAFEAPDRVVVASSYDADDDDFCDLTTIPRGMIAERETLVEAVE